MSLLENLINSIKALGLSKEPIFDGTGYEPSEFSRKLFVSDKTDYDNHNFENPNTDSGKKILVIGADEKYLTMNNGKKFSTGNHPVETLVPMLHYDKAGFESEIFTPGGKPLQFEIWAFPEADENVKNIYAKYKSQFENPKDVAQFSPSEDYCAVFIPGGHGALNGLPFNEDVKKILKWAVENNKFIFTICHGPAVLLALAENNEDKNYPFAGYKINAFPDAMDKQVPEIGYVPGEMPYFFGDRLKTLGVEILNSEISGAVNVDRKLVTGDSPLAANKFGKACAEALLAD